MGSRFPHAIGQFWGGKGLPIVKYRNSAASCANRSRWLNSCLKLPFVIFVLNKNECMNECLGRTLGWVQASVYYMGCILAPPGEYDWVVHVRRRRSLFVRLLWRLVIVTILHKILFITKFVAVVVSKGQYYFWWSIQGHFMAFVFCIWSRRTESVILLLPVIVPYKLNVKCWTTLRYAIMVWQWYI